MLQFSVEDYYEATSKAYENAKKAKYKVDENNIELLNA